MGRLLPFLSALLVVVLVPVPTSAQDALARARQLYNERRFEAAVTAADEGRTPERADAADLVAARAYLERFRESTTEADLYSARDRLRRISPERLNENERVEYLVGVGETLYLEGTAGAAAHIFDALFESSAGLTPAARERVLDWWASALDREARPRADIERQAIYQKILDRMRDELGRNPRSSVAAYWLSAAASGQGDHQAAWDAALAGWVRAPLTSDRGALLRAELDRLVLRAIVPQRARSTAQPPETLQLEWDAFKARWTR